MRPRFKNITLPVSWIAATTGFLVLLSSLPAAGEEPQPQELRERAQQLEREAQELRAQADRIQRQEGPSDAKASAPEELKRKLERVRAELKELRAAGKEDEARERRRQIQELEQQLAPFQRRPESEAGPSPEWRPQPGFPPPGPPPEVQRRLHHLEIAIDNLHAAGLHEPAERLAQEAEAIRRHLQAPPPGSPPPRALTGEVQRLRQEVEDLRHAIRELQERVGRISRDRP